MSDRPKSVMTSTAVHTADCRPASRFGPAAAGAGRFSVYVVEPEPPTALMERGEEEKRGRKRS